jgi:hypothetical protein
MRRILQLMQGIAADKLAEDKATPQRIAESADYFRHLDQQLSGINSLNDAPVKLAETMISADFTYALQEFVQRKMWGAYQQQNFAFEPLVVPDTLPNYLPVTRYLDQNGVDDLEYVGEKAQARPGSVSDLTKRQWQVFVWEKQYDFSHQALVNDDLGYFDSLTAKMGRAARRTLEKFVSRMYFNAVSILTLTTAGALYSTNGRLTTTHISEARMAFNQRVDLRGERILSPMRFIVYHTGLADVVAQIQNSELVPELATNAANVVRGTFTPIEDPYITGTAPNLPWFAFADPANVKTLVLARLAGMPGPVILRKRSDIESITSLLGAGAAVDPIMGDFESGNITVKVRDVWGTYIGGDYLHGGNLVDYQGAWYGAGTAA